MDQPIGVAIAGLGRSGWDIHAKALETLPEQFKIVSVLDAQPERQQEARAKFGCSIAPSYEDFLRDPQVDLIVVATPSHLHEQQTVAALNAGKDVVCEKPMALSIEEADHMIDAARTSKRLLTVFHNMRYWPDFQKIREVIDSGILGRIVQIRLTMHRFGRRWDWQTLKEFGGGSLNNAGAHLLDLSLQLLGPAEPNVTCQMSRTLTSGDAEDHVKVLLRIPDGLMIDVEITNACAYPQDTWHIMGTAGGLRGTNEQLEWKWVDFRKLPPRAVDKLQRDRTFNRETLDWQQQSWKQETAFGADYVWFWEDLYKTLRQGAPLQITAESVRCTMSLLETCRRVANQ